MINNQSISQTSNALVKPLLSTIHLARERAEELRECRELIRISVEMIAEQSARIDRLEATNRHLNAQLRAALSGRTVAEERQAFEREQLDAANGDVDGNVRDSRWAA